MPWQVGIEADIQRISLVVIEEKVADIVLHMDGNGVTQDFAEISRLA